MVTPNCGGSFREGGGGHSESRHGLHGHNCYDHLSISLQLCFGLNKWLFVHIV